MAYNIRLIYLYDLITVVFNDILQSCYDWTGISVTSENHLFSLVNNYVEMLQIQRKHCFHFSK